MKSATTSDPIEETSDTVPCWVCGDAATLLPDYSPLLLFCCPGCGFCFQPTIDSETVRASYTTEYFENYVLARRYEARVRLAFARNFISPPGQLLEVGSATGEFLSEANLAGWDSLGIEPCEEVAEEATKSLGARTIAGFVEDVALEPRSFDLVCGWHVLEHIRDPMPPLSMLRKALRPGGYAIFEVPNFASVYARRDGPRWRYLDPLFHVGQFSPRALRELFTLADFQVRMVTSVPMIAYVTPRDSLRPRQLFRQARYALATGTRGFGSHPDKFDLLRIVAQAPAASPAGDEQGDQRP